MSNLKNIISKYDEKNITFYQAYNNQIVDEALEKGTLDWKWCINESISI